MATKTQDLYEVIWLNGDEPRVALTLATSRQNAADQFVAPVVRVTRLDTHKAVAQ